MKRQVRPDFASRRAWTSAAAALGLAVSMAPPTAAASADAATARNVILLVGDGMGESHVAARFFCAGRDGRLAMETMPHFTQVHTFMNNGVVTDSAAAATALATGVLTDRGVIGLDPSSRPLLERSLLMLAKRRGKSTGLAMAYDSERPAHEPAGAEKLSRALESLSRNPKGFLIMAERGRIDWAAEGNDAPNALRETKVFDEMAAVALDFARRDGRTLVVVTADNLLKSKDGLPMPVNFATAPGHTGLPVGVRAFGPGAEGLRGFNGSQHLMDLYVLLRKSVVGAEPARP